MNSNEHDHVCYALGYYHGRALGIEQNPYTGDFSRRCYREGYDAGVSHYCQETHSEDCKKTPSPNLTPKELQKYVSKHRHLLIAEATKYLDKEDGVWTYWGEVALCIYFDRWDWPKSNEKWYRIYAFPLIETDRGMMEEDMRYFTCVADIRTENLDASH